MVSSSVLLVTIVFWAPAAGPAGTRKTAADQFVGQALQAELDGDNAKRGELLQQALRSSPRCEAARWQTGHVRAGSEWLTLSEAEKAAAEDSSLQRYRKTRAECLEQMTPAMVHLTMARWCRQQVRLTEQARFHWLKLLERNPDEPEALAALGVCRYQGELIDRDEVQTREKARLAVQEWARTLRGLADRLDRKGDSAPAEAAWAELRSISDIAAIPGLETIVAPRSEKLGLEVVALLGQMRSHWAVASLVRLTGSPRVPVRRSAIEQLKRRPLDQTVPWVLANMGWPAKLEQGVLVNAQGDVTYDCLISIEGAEARAMMELNAATVYDNRPLTFVTDFSRTPRPRSYVTLHVPSPAERCAHRQATYQAFAHRAQQTERQVAAHNSLVEHQNAAAGQLLYELTGESRGTDPDAWLDWWTDYSEVTRVGEKPVYHFDNTQSRMVHEGRPRIHIVYTSCFPRGTLIRTQAGLTPIERIQAGDLVLAQHPDTGELAYKAVIQTTLRPPSPLVRIRVEDEEFTATRGHPFWVTGEGWRMAKQLTTRDRLHGLDGSWPIGRMEEIPDDDAYNLVVDEFHTYFVGRLGLLVHDNAPRRPTTAMLPGMQLQ